MTARTLEAGGITTIIIGSAMDIVTHCGVPRYLHNNFPLGNPLGPPFAQTTQRRSIEAALNMALNAITPTIVESDATWPGRTHWQSVYNRVDDSNRAELLKKGEDNRANRLADKARGLKR